MKAEELSVGMEVWLRARVAAMEGSVAIVAMQDDNGEWEETPTTRLWPSYLHLASLSPGLALLCAVRREMGREVRGSDTRHRQAMLGAVRLAITAGLRFDPTDLERPGGLGYGYTHLGEWAREEHFYSEAIGAGNGSFFRAYEYWKDRKPFLLGGKRIGVSAYGDGVYSHRGGDFEWEGVTVRCSSFAEDGSYLTAVSVRDSHHRFRIRREDLKAVEAGVREQERQEKRKVPLRSLAGYIERALNEANRNRGERVSLWEVKLDTDRYSRHTNLQICRPDLERHWLELRQGWGDPEIRAHTPYASFAQGEVWRAGCAAIARVLREHAPHTSAPALADLDRWATERA